MVALTQNNIQTAKFVSKSEDGVLGNDWRKPQNNLRVKAKATMLNKLEITYPIIDNIVAALIY